MSNNRRKGKVKGSSKGRGKVKSESTEKSKSKDKSKDKSKGKGKGADKNPAKRPQTSHRGKSRAAKVPTVVSCLIERPGDEILICSESEPSRTDRGWQFVTGVVEDGESAEAAMRRIARQRVGLEIDIHTGQPPFAGEFAGSPCAYRYFLASITSGEAKPLDYRELRWVKSAQLCEYDFAPVHRDIVQWYVS